MNYAAVLDTAVDVARAMLHLHSCQARTRAQLQPPLHTTALAHTLHAPLLMHAYALYRSSTLT